MADDKGLRIVFDYAVYFINKAFWPAIIILSIVFLAMTLITGFVIERVVLLVIMAFLVVIRLFVKSGV